MRTLRTIIGLIALVTISAFSFAGCNGSQTPDNPRGNELYKDLSLEDAVPTDQLSTSAYAKERAANLGQTKVNGTLKPYYDKYGFMGSSLQLRISGVELLPHEVYLHAQKYTCKTKKTSVVNKIPVMHFGELDVLKLEQSVREVSSLLGTYERVPGLTLKTNEENGSYTLSLKREYVSLPGIFRGKVTYWFSFRNYQADSSQPTPKKTVGSCKN